MRTVQDQQAALELEAARRGVVRIQRQVVEARLAGERQVGCQGGVDEERGPCGEVHDVQAEGEAAGVQDSDGHDGIDLELLRARGKEGGSPAASAFFRSSSPAFLTQT